MAEEQKIVFEWRIGEENIITEEYGVESYRDELREKGSIAEYISLSCMAVQVDKNSTTFKFNPMKMLENSDDNYENSDDNYEPSQFINDIKSFVQGYSQRVEESNVKADNTCINFHILEKIANKFVETECKEAYLNGVTRYINETNSPIIRAMNGIFSLATHKGRPEKKDIGLKYFKDLISEIKKYPRISNETVKVKDKGRCIALYHKNRSTKKTIAFSGFLDSDCPLINGYFNVKKNDLKNYKKIADAIGARLATLNFKVSRYAFNSQAVRYLPLEELIMNDLDRSKENHSCCERKIFSCLEDDNETVYSGKLFVKYAPCIECQAAIFYHIINKGKTFSMYVGLPE